MLGFMKKAAKMVATAGVGLVLLAGIAKPAPVMAQESTPTVYGNGEISAEVVLQSDEISAASVNGCFTNFILAITMERDVKASAINAEGCDLSQKVKVTAKFVKTGEIVTKEFTLDDLYPGRKLVVHWPLEAGDAVQATFEFNGSKLSATVFASKLYPVFYSFDQEKCLAYYQNDPWHFFYLNGKEIYRLETTADAGSIDLKPYINEDGRLRIEAYKYDEIDVLRFKGAYEVDVKNCNPPAHGALTVKKTVNNNSGQPLNPSVIFTITVSGPESYQQVLTFGPEGGSQTLTDLVAGTYTVTEENPGSPWVVVGATQNVEVRSNETALAEVSNTLPPPPSCKDTIAQFGEWSGWSQDPQNSSVEFRVRQIVYLDANDASNVCGVDTERQERPYVPPSSSLYMPFGSKAPEPCRVLVAGLMDDPHYYWMRFNPDWVPQMITNPVFKGKTDWGSGVRHVVWERGSEKWATEFSPIGDNAEYVSAVYHNDKLVVPTATPMVPVYSSEDTNFWLIPVHGKIGKHEFDYFQFQASWSECKPATGKLADLVVFAAAAAQ